MALEESLAELGRELVAREREHSADLEQASRYAKKLHARVASGLEGFHGEVLPEAPHLAVLLGVVDAVFKQMADCPTQTSIVTHNAERRVVDRLEMNL